MKRILIFKKFTPSLKILLLSCHFFWIGQISSQSAPNIIWIVCEDISPYIGAYGDAIVRTPNIDDLAQQGVRYTRVYTTAGVCAPSRSSIITGMNQISIGTHHMRTRGGQPTNSPHKIPSYSAQLPPEVKAFPEYLRQAGYYTTNNAKEDYQFLAPVTVWDESSVAAIYRNRAENQPFFSVFNLAITHESQIISPPDSLYYDSEKMNLPLFYENTLLMRQAKAALYTRIEQMDQHVGQLISQLKADGVYEDSFVLFFSDHGGNLPWTKREVLERGTHIPFIVKHPGGKMAGAVNNDLISSVDFAPSILSIAGIDPPKYLQGKAFLGAKANPEKNRYVFAARDRMDVKYDRVRAVSDGVFRYVYNFHPEVPKYQDLPYRNQITAMQEIISLRKADAIQNPYLLDWFQVPKAQEEPYYTLKDPDEVHNLANDPVYLEKKSALKKVLFDWLETVGDLGKVEESAMIRNWWNGKDEPPRTDKPKIRNHKDGVSLHMAQSGVSIGYRILPETIKDTMLTRSAKSWDFGFLTPQVGQKTIEVPKPWHIYPGGIIPLKKGQVLQINAHRIGQRPIEILYKSK